MMIKNIILAVMILFFSRSVYGQSGIVVSVTDGDTIKVMLDGVQTKIRLYGVDAPEKKQAFGQAAKDFTSAQVVDQIVDVEPVTIDRYGRTVGSVTFQGKNMQEELVKAGFAWVYPPYCKKPVCQDWAVMEQQAVAGKIGLWVDPAPVPPWVWRKKGK